MKTIAQTRAMRGPAICLLAAILGFSLAPTAYGHAKPQHQDHPATRPYTIEEYNSYAAALHTNDFQKRVAIVDGFVSRFPDSQLLPYAYLTYCEAYQHLGDFPQVMKYAERVLSSKDENPKFGVNDRFEIAVAWAEAYTISRALPAKPKSVERNLLLRTPRSH